MSSPFDPSQNLFGAAHYSEDSLKALFAVHPAENLIQNPVFPQICESLVANELAKDAKLKDRLGIPRKKSFNTSGDPDKRLQLIEEFKASLAKTGSKPPSPPSQYARPEAEQVLRDLRRTEEERPQHRPA